jgi:hypothetical protein
MKALFCVLPLFRALAMLGIAALAAQTVTAQSRADAPTYNESNCHHH